MAEADAANSKNTNQGNVLEIGATLIYAAIVGKIPQFSSGATAAFIVRHGTGRHQTRIDNALTIVRTRALIAHSPNSG
jgi:ribose 5-phosphate isomerase RpiB